MSIEKKLDGIFVDPRTKTPLKVNWSGDALVADDVEYSLTGNVAELGAPVRQSGQGDDLSPELRAAHDAAFEEASESGGNIYGSLFDMPAITQAGHYRRMALLDEIPIGDVSGSVVVDFGTGPWGFAAIYPRLASAELCIGFDVSGVACRAAVAETSTEALDRTFYATSDGEVIPLADDSVDVFFGGEVIEHVRNPLVFMQEVARVCKDGAHVVLTTPNRDALPYLLAGEPYATGPEHTALMSVPEFRDVLSRFSTEIALTGYDTSMAPGADEVPLDAALIDAIQLRATNYPELATGVISHSRIDKGLYRANKIDWALKELTWQSEEVKIAGASQVVSLFPGVSGLSIEDLTTVEVPCDGNVPVLMFWGHDWSGHVEIVRGESVWVRDLFLRGAGFVRVELPAVDGASGPIKIRKAGTKADRSASDEVIFYKLLDYTRND